ncbi:MAG: SGNH/GDSL hydrolase family protein [Rhodospirillales bacterium]|nr:SGNH/GDSL hydrolase family protein [Rhodospirillales bacterium]
MTVYVLACGELSIRAISTFVDVYSIEMLEYAKELKIKSPVPEISHEHRPNSSAHLMGVEVTLNSLGHRSAELRVLKGENERRFHVLGSSIALGWGVEAEEGFVGRVENRLNSEKGPQNGHRYTGINAGIGNYNTYYAAELFKRQVDLTKPDVAVLQFYVNDAEQDPKREDSSILRYSLFAAFIYQHIKTLMVVSTKTLAEHYRDLYVEGAPGWQKAKAAIREIKAITDKRGIPLVALLVPELHDLSDNGPYPPIYEKIGAAFEAMGIPMINPLSRFQEAFSDDPSKAWVARNDPHPSASAHKVIAGALFDYLAPKID